MAPAALEVLPIIAGIFDQQGNRFAVGFPA
jgi:hypothetical protein